MSRSEYLNKVPGLSIFSRATSRSLVMARPFFRDYYVLGTKKLIKPGQIQNTFSLEITGTKN